ncbi:hypothetical protein [Virgibacillus sp. YIM 98842]|uniref:hypothetical protein n=1 Tax=Virgibacillus sp. YIM 98842 TaxID=2663533 RepID=UPI001F0985AA|nr:hypothetical protein [Virgibacillus sp. YIM 98842]
MLNKRRIRDEKIRQLKAGRNAYAESHELIRLIKRDIERENLHVHYDTTRTGCWFIPLPNTEDKKSS